jgi:DNA topoisomerase-3
VAREQMSKLLLTGKTELLENFVSNKTRRKFKAYLAYDKKEGKVSFEFEPRPERPGAKGGAAAKAATKTATKTASKAPAAKKATTKKAA